MNNQYNNQLEFLDIVTVLSFAFQLKTQDENNRIKKSDELTEDERDMCLDIVQELIDKYNKIVDEKCKEKEVELTSI